MIELDVQMTRDQRLVIFHDDRLERTTDGRGRLSHLRYNELVRLDAGSWFDPQFAGERILLVSQALRLVPRSIHVNLELKQTSRRPILLRRLLQLADRLHCHSRLLISSFDHRFLEPLKSLQWQRALICSRDADRSLRCAIRLGCTAWHPIWKFATADRIARAHHAGLRVHVWTIDDLDVARRLLDWGVDGFFTNDPRRLSRLRRRHRSALTSPRLKSRRPGGRS